jgi:hypothetical protein
MEPARLFRNGVEVEPSGEQGEQELQDGAIRLAIGVSATCPRCDRERARRRKTSRVARYWFREARILGRHVKDLEARFGIVGVAPDAQLAAMAATVNMLRERLAQQEKRFGAANARNDALSRFHETRINKLQRRLEKSLLYIARLKGSPSPS